MSNAVKDFFNEIADEWNNEKNNYDVISYLFSLLPLKNNDDVLDLGCGKGVISPFINKITNNKVIGIDLSEKMIEGALLKNSDKSKYEYICGDYLNYKFKKNFDSIIIFNAFPHFLDKKALAKKAYNDLKENGYLIIMHDLGKERLNNHHNKCANKISNGLLEPSQEYNSFNDLFLMEKFIDENDRYLMILKRN